MRKMTRLGYAKVQGLAFTITMAMASQGWAQSAHCDSCDGWAHPQQIPTVRVAAAVAIAPQRY